MKNILIKGSGDVIDSQEFFDFTVDKALHNYVVVICGAGTKTSKALSDAGFEPVFDSLMRRLTITLEERTIMRNVQEQEVKRLEDKFVGAGVVVVAPLLYAGSVLCPINGDDLVKAYDLGFDEIYVFTKEGRLKKKQAIFQGYERIEIIALSDL